MSQSIKKLIWRLPSDSHISGGRSVQPLMMAILDVMMRIIGLQEFVMGTCILKHQAEQGRKAQGIFFGIIKADTNRRIELT